MRDHMHSPSALNMSILGTRTVYKNIVCVEIQQKVRYFLEEIVQ